MSLARARWVKTRSSKLFGLGFEWSSSRHVMTKSFVLSDLWVALTEVALVKVRSFQGSGLVGVEGAAVLFPCRM
jgi:hypothetical protein